MMGFSAERLKWWHGVSRCHHCLVRLSAYPTPGLFASSGDQKTRYHKTIGINGYLMVSTYWLVSYLTCLVMLPSLSQRVSRR